VAGTEIAAKKYVVRLSAEEREQMSTLIQSGKHAARKLLKARILLKADVSETGEGWSDGQIAEALDTSVDTIGRTRRLLVEEGLEAALAYKYSPASARPRIFDGAAEAKLIALACSEPPKGRARWTLELLEEKVVELKIVDRTGSVRISVCEAFSVSPRLGKSLYRGNRRLGKLVYIHVPWFDQSTCSSVPTWAFRWHRAQARSNSPACGGTGATHSPARGRAWRGPTI
jgi:transposase